MVRKRGGQRISVRRASVRSGSADLEVVAIKGLLILALLAGSWLSAARAVASEPLEGAADASAAGSGTSPEALYASYSNEALTALAAQWDALDVHQRRALLTELRQRMARNGSSQGSGIIHIRTERRFGRIIRQPDGRVIRIETKVVQVRPIPESALAGGGYGVGFERRAEAGQVAEAPGATSTEQAALPVTPAATPAQPPVEAQKPFAAPVLQPSH
jgi:hypothetical protein